MSYTELIMSYTELMGKYIRNLCAEKKIDKTQLAEKLKMNETEIEDFFEGKFVLPYWKLVELASILDISVSQIIDGGK